MLFFKVWVVVCWIMGLLVIGLLKGMLILIMLIFFFFRILMVFVVFFKVGKFV